MTDSVADRVRHYFDENTRLFLRLGQGSEGTIRRAVWGPGVTDRAAAMVYVDELVMPWLERVAPGGEQRRVVDLGSGLCASLCRMARRFPIQGTGITLSQTQVDLARLHIDRQGLAASVRCLRGDFCALPEEVGPADLAFAIESFVLASSAETFFQECAKLVRPGGYLIVCDDFLADARWREDERAAPWLERFEKGWIATNLVTSERARTLAERAGFIHEATQDLSAHLEIGRPRDRATGLLMRSLGWLPITHPYWLMLYGGHALQVCLKRDWIRYLFTVWKRQ